MSDTFTCAHCGETYTKGWSEAEARAEAEQWGDALAEQGEAVICDGCYQEFMVWAHERGLVPHE